MRSLGAQLTKRQYAAEGGIRCPFCKCANVNEKPLKQCEDGKVRGKCICTVCNAIWYAVYKLVGYEKESDGI